jgi:hypothetical protein
MLARPERAMTSSTTLSICAEVSVAAANVP